MGLKDIDFDSALRRLADRKIEEAIREGKFSNLEGHGKPLDLEPMPADEGARLRWWALRLLKQNDVTPEEVRWRKRIDGLKDELSAATTEARVRALVNAINGLVRQLNTLGTNALNSPVGPVYLETELQRLRERVTSTTGASASSAEAQQPVPTHSPQRPPASLLPRSEPDGRIRHCTNQACRSRNPPTAKYCRRCGATM